MVQATRASLATPARTRATIRDIARAAGVSKATVSRVLSGAPPAVRISPATQVRVRQAAIDLDYQPHAAARALGLQRTEHIAIVIPAAPSAEDEHHRFSHLKISEVLSAIDGVTRARGYNVVLQITTGDPFADSRHTRLWKSRAVDGILWYAQPLDMRIGTLGCPVVGINSAPVEGLPVSTVNADNYAGAYLAVQHLARLGHTRIAHIAGPANTWNAAERLRGYRDSLREQGLDPVVEPADFFEASGAAAIKRLLLRAIPPTAVFVSGDLVAIGAIAELRAHGLDVPGDVAIVGSDGVEFGRYVAPALTTVGMLMFATARRAAELLLDTISGDVKAAQQIRTPVELGIGGSCGYRLGHPDAPAVIRIDDMHTPPGCEVHKP